MLFSPNALLRTGTSLDSRDVVLSHVVLDPGPIWVCVVLLGVGVTMQLPRDDAVAEKARG
jgi:hypothetical protein